MREQESKWEGALNAMSERACKEMRRRRREEKGKRVSE